MDRSGYMPLGAYSIIRFSNNLNDQRVNLGVVVWHPQDGVQVRFSSALTRVHAIDGNIRPTRLKIQLSEIKAELESGEHSDRSVLDRLASRFRAGVEVSSPYPARMCGLRDTLDRLFDMLVSSSGSAPKHDSQFEFAEEFKVALSDTLLVVGASDFNVEEMGNRRVNGVYVDLGIRTTVGHTSAFWHPLSLLSKNRPNAQIAKAKATALEIRTIRESFSDYSNVQQWVAVQAPAHGTPEYIKDSIAWLRHGADDVLVVPEKGSLQTFLEPKLRQFV
jgi:Protein of unknown function (DUF3037)